MYLTRIFEFAASHRLHNPQLSDKENTEIFGKCANKNGHGHDYILEVTVKGDVDPRTGMVVDMALLDQVVEKQLIQHVDHKHLNFDVSFLEGINPSAENVVVAFWKELAPAVPGPATLYRLRLRETSKNICEYFGPL